MKHLSDSDSAAVGGMIVNLCIEQPTIEIITAETYPDIWTLLQPSTE